jgi:predicted Ser/Thr protein kinase
MSRVDKAMERIARSMDEWGQQAPVPFEEYLRILTDRPTVALRNIFQLFHDMIKSYISEGVDEYPDDPESIHYALYDCSRLFVEETDHPFFADRLFANRLVNLVEALKRGTQQNKIYIFEGPHGCGKSTFLNNLLMRFEKYANTPEGSTYEAVWRLDRRVLGSIKQNETNIFLDKLEHLLEEYELRQSDVIAAKDAGQTAEDYIEVPCPSHDHPVLMVPKDSRRSFLEDLFYDDPRALELLADKEYEWLFRSSPCTICSSLYHALLGKLKNPIAVLRMLYVRPLQFNRRLGEGISVYNPGDKPMKQTILGNDILQNRINALLQDSNQVRYIFSRFAKTNNGIYALMDIKSHNVERLMELHNIISEGVHKVEDVEENVNSLFLALMNPEDKENIRDFPSFSDRIEYIKTPYVLDISTEVEIYRNIFGRHIDESFLPRVLHNFARVIISSRLNIESEAMKEWIGDPGKYRLYCDPNLQLLKMEIYTGYIPKWLTEEDRKRLTAKRRRKIIAESEQEGERGFSGRESIKIFNDFYSMFARKDRLIDMSVLRKYFTKIRRDLSESIPEGFLDSLVRMYNYSILQEVKESLYYYNEEQISRDIQNYLFAVNFEPGTTERCKYTRERLEITEEFFAAIEGRLLGAEAERDMRQSFRKETQKEYTSRTLTQEIVSEGKPVTETGLYRDLYLRYVYNLKEKALDPFLENENFRRAIKDYETDDFKTYDKRIRDDVDSLINNLVGNYHYTEKGAKEVCIYVIDNNLAREFAAP